MSRRLGLRLPSRIALVVLVLAVVAAVATIGCARRIDRVGAERDAAAAAADSAAVLAAALRTQITDVGVARSADEPGVTGAVATSEGVSTDVLTLARDSGVPVLDDSADGVVVVATYTGEEPRSVQERRDRLSGYRIVPLDLATTLKSLQPEGGGIAVNGPDRRILGVPASGPGSAASFTASLGPDLPVGWTLTAWTAPPGTPTPAWLICALLLAAGVAAATWVTSRQSEARRRRVEMDDLQEGSSTVAALATLAQRTTDLGETLPAVTTELSAALGLRGLSLAVPSPHGERVIFVHGAPPDRNAPTQRDEELAAGQTRAAVLSRGGRIVATLRVTAGRDLGRTEMRTLLAAGEVLASALATADLFSQQAEVITRMRTVDELKTVFLATASHELRTPVAAMAGYANLLHSSWDQLTPDQARGFAERVDRVAQRLSRLVEDILDFSRLQSGSSSGTTATVLDLGATVAQVLEEQPDLAPDHHLVNVPAPGLHVSGSVQAVERVVANLVGNAAKYSPSGTTIRVLTRQVGDRAELVVEDEGPGIAPDQREQVFSPFYRGSGDEVVRTQGAGLGLAIVAEFAGSMGGRAHVEEAPGGGASFVVSYPIAAPTSITAPNSSPTGTDAALDPGAARVQA